MTMRGLISRIFSHGKPKPLEHAGAEVLHDDVALLQQVDEHLLAFGVFMLTVIERLLQLSIVKYRLSAFGTSRSWPRVASPCGFSNLITSAPSHASSWLQVVLPGHASCPGCVRP
jgi:hypothetical protein